MMTRIKAEKRMLAQNLLILRYCSFAHLQYMANESYLSYSSTLAMIILRITFGANIVPV